MNQMEEVVTSLKLELRRGTIVLCVLSQLKTPQYGYSLVQNLESSNVSVDTGILYPLLRRLEKQGLLESEWETDSSKPRKYYRRTMLGDRVFRELEQEWQRMVASMNVLFGGREHES